MSEESEIWAQLERLNLNLQSLGVKRDLGALTACLHGVWELGRVKIPRILVQLIKGLKLDDREQCQQLFADLWVELQRVDSLIDDASPQLRALIGEFD